LGVLTEIWNGHLQGTPVPVSAWSKA
jgi:hypothetical protein